MTPSFWAMIATILSAIVAITSAFITWKLNKDKAGLRATADERRGLGSIIETLWAELDRQERKIGDLRKSVEGQNGVLQSARSDLIDAQSYIADLRQHIVNKLPPPPPPWEAKIRDAYERGRADGQSDNE